MKTKIALVTGGLRGIGEAISTDLAQNGFITYTASRGGSVPTSDNRFHLEMDLQDEESISEAFKFIEEKHGSLDVLVNNAGVMINKPFTEFEKNDWEQVYQTNVFGPISCIQKSFPLMKEDGGRIINISSIMTRSPLPNTSLYTSSKHALNGLGEALGEEWFKDRVMTTNLILGATYTDLWKNVEGFSQADMLSTADVARMVAFIANTPLHIRIDRIEMTPPKGVL
ncbi:SDR family oxidoreductase [Paenibacillus sp. FSL H8-0034]|uniref:SDR family oxidoreductase n=1 Tax=Paenibacillus sp. FSL H8-0034 TaxID=2954671 RepID=UPI0030F59B13